MFMYVPGVVETVTRKCTNCVPVAGTGNAPLQVRTCPAMVGLAVVAPVVEPGT